LGVMRGLEMLLQQHEAGEISLPLNGLSARHHRHFLQIGE
jgi:hypothetical protein